MFDVESTKKRTRNERTKLDLCQGREMKSSKRSSLFANNPTIPDIDEYVKRRISLIKKELTYFIIEKTSKQQMKKYLVQHHRWIQWQYILIS